MSRRALLLAISDYDPLQPLSYVSNDIPRLTTALTRAGFHPDHIVTAGAGAGEVRLGNCTSTRLREAIGDFLDGAEAHDDLLIFFSGHGLELEGRRILLPQDFTPKRPASPADLVSDGWISTYVRTCKAQSVLVLTDVVREGARYELTPKKSSPILENCDAPLQYEYEGKSTDAQRAFIYSCAERICSRRPRSRLQRVRPRYRRVLRARERTSGTQICNECRQRLEATAVLHRR